MSRLQALTFAASYFDDGRYFTDLSRRVACRTESDGGVVRPELEAYLRQEMQPVLQTMGFVCEIHANPSGKGGPFMVARRVEDARLPTVFSYAHGDVVNGQAELWQNGRDPWVLRAEGDRWYGRGTADNKGQHSINLAALAAVLGARAGKLGYNVCLLLETGEEAASPGLHEFCKAQAEHLRADLFLASDGPRVRSDQPTLFLGSRGAVNFTLRLRCRERGFHSGNWGGVLTNPAIVLTHALATLVDRSGRILIPGLRPPAIPASVRKALAKVDIGGDTGDPALDPQWGEPGLTPAEQLVGWNSLEILAMVAGNPQRPVNAVPPEATAHCQLRFVVGTPWQDLESIVRQHLDAQGFPDIGISITLTGAATRLDPDNPWVRWAETSITASCGKSPTVLPNLAGSLPNEIFADLLGLPTLWVPHSYPGCAQHAPNEHLLAPLAREGLQVMAGLLWDLGEASAPWPARNPQQASPPVQAAQAPRNT